MASQARMVLNIDLDSALAILRCSHCLPACRPRPETLPREESCSYWPIGDVVGIEERPQHPWASRHIGPFQRRVGTGRGSAGVDRRRSALPRCEVFLNWRGRKPKTRTQQAQRLITHGRRKPSRLLWSLRPPAASTRDGPIGAPGYGSRCCGKAPPPVAGLAVPRLGAS